VTSTGIERQRVHSLDAPIAQVVSVLCTHNPKKKGSSIDLYTTFPWEAFCGEVQKLVIRGSHVFLTEVGEGLLRHAPASAECWSPPERGLVVDAASRSAPSNPRRGQGPPER
jgi:hypothetical protein